MPFARVLGFVLLILALSCNGLAAPDAAAADIAVQHSGCHDGAAPADPAPAPAPDCCDGAGCTCACIQHAPAVLLGFAPLELARFSPPPVVTTWATWSSASTAPQLRPPIA